jgi:hypothetical protein
MKLTTDLSFIKFISFYPPATDVRCVAEVLGSVREPSVETDLRGRDLGYEKAKLPDLKGVVVN